MNLIQFNKKFLDGDSSALKKISSRVSFWSVFLGAFALILSLSVLEGFEEKLHENVYLFEAHIKTSTFDATLIEDLDTKLAIVNGHDEVLSVEACIENYAVFDLNGVSDGFLVKGVSPNYLSDRNFRVDGELSKNSIVLSNSIRKKYSLNISDEIVLFSGNENNVKVKKLRISGFYDSGFSEFDDKLVFADYEFAKVLFSIPDNKTSSLEILTKDVNESRQLARKLDEAFTWPYISLSVLDKHQAMFKWIEIQKTPIPIVLALISLVAAFNVITSLLITIVEKVKGIGILRTLGMSKKKIIYLITLGGIRTGFKGVVFGLISGNLLLFLESQLNIISLPSSIYFVDSVPIKFVFLHNIIIFSSVILIIIIFSLIPALIATRFEPVKVIRDY